MFSDAVFDSLNEILECLTPKYAHPDVYPREVVINMIAAMLLTVMVSTCRNPPGLEDKYGEFSANRTLDDIRQNCLAQATKVYDEKVKTA
jgi:hypothetical protein